MTWEDSGDGEFPDFEGFEDPEWDDSNADWEDELGEELDNAGAR